MPEGGTVARRILAGPPAAAGPVLELGGGTGPVGRELAGHGVHVVVADLAAMLSQAPRPAVRTDARAVASWPARRAGSTMSATL